MTCAAGARTQLPPPPPNGEDKKGCQGRVGSRRLPAASAASRAGDEGEGEHEGAGPPPVEPQTELVLCFERQGEGWAEEIFPRVSLQRRAIPTRAGLTARSAGLGATAAGLDPGLAPGTRDARRRSAGSFSSSSSDSEEEEEEEEAAAAAVAGAAAATTATTTTTSPPPAPPPRPNRAAGRLRAPRWEPGSLEAFLASPAVGLSRAEVGAVVQAATSWRVTPGGRPLVDRSLRGRAERGAPGVVAYLTSPDVGAPPGRPGVGAALLAAPHALLTRPARHDRWDRRFVQLAHFVGGAGHAHVPDHAPGGLGAWAARQRIAWQAGALDGDRSDWLAAAGFDFGEVALLTDAWEARFDQLLELRLTAAAAAAGVLPRGAAGPSSTSALAAALPGGSPGDWLGMGWGRVAGPRGRALAVWCALQRALRRRALLPDCVAARLDAVGFDWRADGEEEEEEEGAGGEEEGAAPAGPPARGVPPSDRAFMASLGDLARQVERARGAAARAAAAAAAVEESSSAGAGGAGAAAARAAGAAAAEAARAASLASAATPHHAHPHFAMHRFAMWGLKPAAPGPAAGPPRPRAPAPQPTLTPGEVALEAEPSQRRAAFAAALVSAGGRGGAGRAGSPAAAPAAAPPLDARARRFALRSAAAWLGGRLPRERAALLRVAGWDPEVLALPPLARGGAAPVGEGGDGWLGVADAAAAAAAGAAARALRLGGPGDDDAAESGAAAAAAAASPRLIARWARTQRALAVEGALGPGRAAALAVRDLGWVLQPPPSPPPPPAAAAAAAGAAAAAPPPPPTLPARGGRAGLPRPVTASRSRAASAAALGSSVGGRRGAADGEQPHLPTVPGGGGARPRPQPQRLTAGVV